MGEPAPRDHPHTYGECVKGIRMASAFHSDRGIVSADDAEAMIDYRDWRCEIASCRAPVVHVGSHTREYYKEKYKVAAYFRLKTATQPHAEDCKYNLLGRIRHIARRAPTTVLEAIEKGRYAFRLRAVREAMQVIRQSSTKDIGQGGSESDRAAKSEPTTEDVKAAIAVLRTAGDVVLLRTHVSANADVAAHIELYFDTKVIRWSDFYYEPDRFFRLYERLHTTSTKPNWPVAVAGHVNRVEPPTPNWDRSTLVLARPSRREDAGPVEIAGPRFVCTSPEPVAHLKEGDQIVVYGLCSAKRPVDRTSKKDSIPLRFYDITGALYTTEQVQRI